VIPRVAPDVVLLDMRMPNLSGLDVLNALRAKDELPPTIILTTFDDDQMVLAGLKAGARGYLLKDVSLAELVRAIRTVAGRHGCSAYGVGACGRGLETAEADFPAWSLLTR
jgi:DNA-binding NarL/FixJ family response regulator